MKWSEYAEKLKNLYQKAKKIKHIEIYVGVVIICIIALIYSTVTVRNKASDESSTGTADALQTAELERRLEEILSEIDGAGEVDVLITFASSAEIVTANSTTTQVTQNQSGTSSTSSTSTTETAILVNNNGQSEVVVTKEIMPEIRGVVIVAKGAKDIKVRLSLIRAAQIALGVDANAIEIFAKK